MSISLAFVALPIFRACRLAFFLLLGWLSLMSQLWILIVRRLGTRILLLVPSSLSLLLVNHQHLFLLLWLLLPARGLSQLRFILHDVFELRPVFVSSCGSNRLPKDIPVELRIRFFERV